MFNGDSERSMVADLTEHLSSLVSCIKNKDFSHAQDLVANEIRELVDRLAASSAPIADESDHLTQSDYVEEKSIGL